MSHILLNRADRAIAQSQVLITAAKDLQSTAHDSVSRRVELARSPPLPIRIAFPPQHERAFYYVCSSPISF